jgi:class 3 adenylate cyclase
MLPESVCDRLKDNPAVIADKFDQSTVLFADIVGFTDLSTRVPAEEVVRLLNELFSRFDALADDFGVEKIKTIGDAYMVAAGVPEPRGDHAHVSAEMALAMLDCVRRFNDEQGQTFAVRIGMHSGPLVGGVIGVRKFLYDIWGDTVNIASRMESTGIVGQIQVTDETRRRLRHQYHFTDRGLQTVKGRGEMHTWLLTGRMGEATMQRQAHLKRTGSASLAALLSDQ